MSLLIKSAQSSEKDERVRAIQAQRYARRRLEGLVKWDFQTKDVERKDLITWAFDKVQKYFRKV